MAAEGVLCRVDACRPQYDQTLILCLLVTTTTFSLPLVYLADLKKLHRLQAMQGQYRAHMQSSQLAADLIRGGVSVKMSRSRHVIPTLHESIPWQSLPL